MDPAALIQVWQHLLVDPAMLDAAREPRGRRRRVRARHQPAPRARRVHEGGARLRLDLEPMIISAEIGVAKPDPPSSRSRSRASACAEQVLFVDDVLANVEGARSVGLAAEHFAKDAGRPRARPHPRPPTGSPSASPPDETLPEPVEGPGDRSLSSSKGRNGLASSPPPCGASRSPRHLRDASSALRTHRERPRARPEKRRAPRAPDRAH